MSAQSQPPPVQIYLTEQEQHWPWGAKMYEKNVVDNYHNINEYILKWIAALRSGNYIQNKKDSCLITENGYSIYGVLIECTKTNKEYFYKNNIFHLDTSVRDRQPILNKIRRTLYCMNMSILTNSELLNLSFKDWANFIEEFLWKKDILKD